MFTRSAVTRPSAIRPAFERWPLAFATARRRRGRLIRSSAALRRRGRW
jgi:hypothetical protein